MMESRIRELYPDHVPVIINLEPGLKQNIKRVKYLLEPSVTVGHFIFKIRKSFNTLHASDALFTLIDNRMVSLNKTFGELDNNKPDFIHMHITKHETFG